MSNAGVSGVVGMKKKSAVWNVVIAGLLPVVILCAVLMGLQTKAAIQTPLVAGQAQLLRAPWYGEDGTEYTLPLKIPYPASGRFSLQTTLQAEQLTDNATLLLSGKYMNTSIYLDGKQIGAYTCQPAPARHTHGKAYAMISLQAAHPGSELRIESELLCQDAVSYEFSAPRIGSSEQILTGVIARELPVLSILFATFCFGVLLLLFSAYAKHSKDRATFFYTSVFSFVFAVYSLSITESIYLFFPHAYLIYICEFIFLALLPLPILLLLYYNSKPRYQRLIQLNLSLVMLNVVVQLALDCFTALEFRELLLCTHAVMVVSLFVMVFCILRGSVSKSERNQLLITFSPVFATTILDMVLFYQPIVDDKAFLFQLGVLLFVILQTSYLIRSYLRACEDNVMMRVYQDMAYLDALTGIENRTAFEQKIEELESKRESWDSLWCICADINGLKMTNDTYGHAKGDALIRAAASCMKKAMTADSFLYRTGGDEFVLFVVNRPERMVQELLAEISNQVRSSNEETGLELSISIGYDGCMQGEKSLQQLLKSADARMYEQKRALKLGV